MAKNSDIPVTGNQSPVTIVLKGFCMGAADVVPGGSGGTMALILNIYPRLINAIKSFDLDWLKGLVKLDRGIVLERPHWGFIIPLLVGVICALFFFTRVISLPELIETKPELVYGLFFGLIAGSILVLVMQTAPFTVRSILFLLAGIWTGLVIFNLVPAETPDTGWFIFIAGALAISAMLLPGISGSFILLILKKYSYIFNAIGYLDFSILIPFILGVLTGLVAFSRLLSYLLARYYRSTLLLITGLLVASLWVIWPFQQRVYETIGDRDYLIHTTPVLPSADTENIVMAFVLMATGVIFVVFIDFHAKKRNSE